VKIFRKRIYSNKFLQACILNSYHFFYGYCVYVRLMTYVFHCRLPDHVSLDEGAMLEPLAVAVYSCKRGNVGPGSRVLICGAGNVYKLYITFQQNLKHKIIYPLPSKFLKWTWQASIFWGY
jgi:hypothetical protein